MTRRFKPPVYHSSRRSAWVLNIGDDERSMILRLFGELREVLTSDDGDEAGNEDGATAPMLRRLFPTAYPDDVEKEAEYQRLMRDDLVTSRVTQIDAAVSYLAEGALGELDEGQIVGFMQSINAVRVVLGTMLDVGEDDDEPGEHDGAERHLYDYLSWLLDWTVRALN